MHTSFHSGDLVATDVGARCQIVLLPAQEMSGGPQDERHPASLVRHHVGRTETDTGTRCVCFRSELDAALLQCGLQRGDRCYPNILVPGFDAEQGHRAHARAFRQVVWRPAEHDTRRYDESKLVDHWADD